MSLHPTCTHTRPFAHARIFPNFKHMMRSHTHAHGGGLLRADRGSERQWVPPEWDGRWKGGRPGGYRAYKEMKWLALIWPHKDVDSCEPRVSSAGFRLRWRSDLSCVWEAVTQWQTGLWLPLLHPDLWSATLYKLTDLTSLCFFLLPLPVLLLSPLSCSHFHKVKVPHALKPQQPLLTAPC